MSIKDYCSTINHEAAKAWAAEITADEYGNPISAVGMAQAYLDLAEKLEAAHAKIEKYQRRLEITHCYDGHTGERKEIPPDKRDTHPDGIECRDSTIYALKTELTAERQRVNELEAALGEAIESADPVQCDIDRLTAIKEGQHE